MTLRNRAKGAILSVSVLTLIAILANAFAAVGAVAPSYTGQTQFLAGFYDVSWAGTEERKYAALEKVGAAGFTLMAPALELDDDAYLKRAAEFGMKIIVEPNDEDGTRNQRKVWANRPEVIGWIVADDFNYGSGIPISNIITRHNEMKQDAPSDASYMSGGVRNIAPYFGYTDMIGVQLYSIPYDPLYMTDIFLRDTIIARGTKTTRLVANVQTYAAPGYRAPDAMEVRSMTYQSLANNVDAILYYTYFDQTWNMDRYPALWAGIAPIGGELRALNEVIMKGTLTRVSSPTQGLIMFYWTYGGKYYVVINNATYNAMNNVTMPLPVSGRVTNMFPSRPAGFAFSGNNLVGNIEAKGVHVYIIDPAGMSTATPPMVATPTLVKTATPVPTIVKTATVAPTIVKTATVAPTIVKTATPVPTVVKTATPIKTATPVPTVVKTATPIKTATTAPTAVKTALPAATSTQATNMPTVTRLVLVNTETGADIMTLTNGAVINTTTTGGTKYNIRADVGTVATGSVRFDLNGILFKVENSKPFAMAGDTGTKYYAWSYTNNTRYTVSARPYSGLNQTGTAGIAYSVTFTLTNGQTVAGNNPTAVSGVFNPTATATSTKPATATPVATKTLVPTNTAVPPTATFTSVPPTATNTLIPTFTPTLVPTFTPTFLPSATPALIPSATITETPIVIPTVFVPTAIPPTAIPQVVMPTQPTIIIIGDGQTPPTATPQPVIVIVDPVVQPTSVPVVVLPTEQPPVVIQPTLAPVVVQPTLAPVVPTAVPSTFSVVSFTLVNVDTGADILTIGNGMTIDMNTLGTRKITIRANTQGTIGSVIFALDANARFKVENMAPYTIYDDTGSSYYAWPYTLGQHTLSATPYSAMMGGGTAGSAYTVQFTLIDSAIK